ncbi:hypothetical protein L9F63_024025, partial [Diploptera punctata]
NIPCAPQSTWLSLSCHHTCDSRMGESAELQRSRGYSSGRYNRIRKERKHLTIASGFEVARSSGSTACGLNASSTCSVLLF